MCNMSKPIPQEVYNFKSNHVVVTLQLSNDKIFRVKKANRIRRTSLYNF